MNRTSTLLALIFLLASVAIGTAQTVSASGTRALPVPQPTATPGTANADSDDLKTQEKILAELEKLRLEKAGWFIERGGLEGTIKTLTREVEIEKKRGDFFEKALAKAEAIDTNSQKMDTNAVFIQTTLETRVAEKNARIGELTDDLRSCKNNQKWILGTGVVAGGVAGWLIKGQADRVLGAGLARDAASNFRFTPISQPAERRQVFELYRK